MKSQLQIVSLVLEIAQKSAEKDKNYIRLLKLSSCSSKCLGL